MSSLKDFESTDSFVDRHIGPQSNEINLMLQALKQDNLESFISKIVPNKIRMNKELDLMSGKTEVETLAQLKKHASENKVFRSYIGTGYYGTITPAVIKRNILENPGWYTQYTPYQAEISQGRLEALLNFQTMIMDLTGLPIANASLLDEATAAAEAMTMSYAIYKSKNPNTTPETEAHHFFADKNCHPQTLALLHTRAEPLDIKVVVDDFANYQFKENLFGALVQYPNTNGEICDFLKFSERLHRGGGSFVMATDLMALTLLKSPGELGADIAIGSSQRFGVPMGFGGPHAAFLSTKDEYKRLVPGRIIGLSQDSEGRPAARLALQTREQHIRREKATSNICTAQVLLAIMSGMYATYHGPKRLKKIAERLHAYTDFLSKALKQIGHNVTTKVFFDTIAIEVDSKSVAEIDSKLLSKKINLKKHAVRGYTISIDETVGLSDLSDLLECFSTSSSVGFDALLSKIQTESVSKEFLRTSSYLTHPVFNRYHTETELLRYITRLQSKDLSLTTSMIALGSCTMKLNATAEMEAVTWPEFSLIHPFAPSDQTQGYLNLFNQLEGWLSEITGFSGISLQPNAGSQGEYAGLLVIRKYHQSRNQGHRNICLIPKSAHGTNPASAVMAGMKVVIVECDSNGNVDLVDLKNKAKQHESNLAAAMITYPSTHGVFEESIVEFCELVHSFGGQVYMDGANMNAQVGLCRPADFGPDVCHLNLHKTFCIPHGGGGPGMGPIGVKEHLVPFLPKHPVVQLTSKTNYSVSFNNEHTTNCMTISAAPWGSSSILPISWAYINMMGSSGLKKATEVAILNANYIANRLDPYYPVLYKGKNGFVAHECIIDLRKIKDVCGIEVEDVAKRLMDYGFHAPTISFPVPGTIMIEPTESESLSEIDRFCEAMISIRTEISEVESGSADRSDNVLKNAPHTSDQMIRADWKHQYSREKAAFPASWTRQNKFWPPVSRVNQALGDRNLICSCPPIDQY